MLVADLRPTAQQIKEQLLQSIDRDGNVVNMDGVLQVISVLEEYSITKEALEETRLGRCINNLRKKTSNEELAKRAKRLLRSWQKIAVGQLESDSAISSKPASGACQSAQQCPQDRTVQDVKECLFTETNEAKNTESDNRNIPPSSTPPSVSPCIQLKSRLHNEDTEADSLEIIPSPTPDPASPGFSCPQLFYKLDKHKHNSILLSTGKVHVDSSRAAKVPNFKSFSVTETALDIPKSSDSGSSSSAHVKHESWYKAIQEPASLETISPASFSTPPHSPATMASDYSVIQSYRPSGHHHSDQEMLHNSLTSKAEEHIRVSNTHITFSPTVPERDNDAHQNDDPSNIQTSSFDLSKVTVTPSKTKSKKGMKKSIPKDYIVNLDGPQSDTSGKLVKLKERKITYDPISGQIVLAQPKNAKEQKNVTPCDQTESVAELRERNLQIWDSMDHSNWKQLAKNEIIQKYFSSQYNRLTSSGLGPSDYLHQLKDYLDQKVPSPTTGQKEPQILLASEVNSDIPVLSSETAKNYLTRLHDQHWPGVNGSCDNKGNWYDWTECISLEPHSDGGKLYIFPYVCLD